MCTRWRKNYLAFLEDMGARPPGKTLDRIDPTGDYSARNCQWASPAEQALNRRSTLTVKLHGQVIPLMKVSKITKIPYQTLRTRLHAGWSDREVLEGRQKREVAR